LERETLTLTSGNKPIHFNHHSSLFSERYRLSTIIKFRRQENPNHSQALSTGVIIDLYIIGERIVLQMRDPDKDVATWREIQAVGHIDVRLLPVGLEDVGGTTLTLDLQATDFDPWEVKLVWSVWR
jgi:hypothetical protein